MNKILVAFLILASGVFLIQRIKVLLKKIGKAF